MRIFDGFGGRGVSGWSVLAGCFCPGKLSRGNLFAPTGFCGIGLLFRHNGRGTRPQRADPPPAEARNSAWQLYLSDLSTKLLSITSPPCPRSLGPKLLHAKVTAPRGVQGAARLCHTPRASFITPSTTAPMRPTAGRPTPRSEERKPHKFLVDGTTQEARAARSLAPRRAAHRRAFKDLAALLIIPPPLSPRLCGLRSLRAALRQVKGTFLAQPKQAAHTAV